MANELAYNMQVLVSELDLSGFATALDGPTVDVEQLETTTLGSTGWRTYTAGLKRFMFSMSGYTDMAAGSLDAIVGPSTVPLTGPVSVMPDGIADGSLAYLARTLTTSGSWGAQVGELSTFSLEAVGRDAGIARGLLLHPTATARTSSSTGTGRQLGAVASGQTMYAALHVVTVSGTTPSLTVKLQSDDNGSFTSPTDRITFTAATAETSEWQSVAGAITDDYWRISYTISGTNPSFAFAVTAGIA